VLMYFQVPAKTPGPGHTAEGCGSRSGRVRPNPVPLVAGLGQSLAWPVPWEKYQDPPLSSNLGHSRRPF
jgi:hypothetical protein